MLLGLGALGAGALGAGVSLLRDPDGGTAESAGPSEPPVTSTHGVPTSTGAKTDADPTTTPASMEANPTTSTTSAAVAVVVACREAWGALPASAAMVEHAPVRLTLHHTAVSQDDLDQGPARARRHQRYHQSLGWPDLAYHFLVDRSGLAYEGRDVGFRGDTATEYDPTGHFLVCLEGNYDVQEPSGEQLDTAVALFAWASQRYDIDATTLAGHREYAPSTTCPGSAVSAMIPDLAVAVTEAGPVELDLVCGPDAIELIATLESR